jgi:hypothetical protein
METKYLVRVNDEVWFSDHNKNTAWTEYRRYADERGYDRVSLSVQRETLICLTVNTTPED